MSDEIARKREFLEAARALTNASNPNHRLIADAVNTLSAVVKDMTGGEAGVAVVFKSDGVPL